MPTQRGRAATFASSFLWGEAVPSFAFSCQNHIPVGGARIQPSVGCRSWALGRTQWLAGLPWSPSACQGLRCSRNPCLKGNECGLQNQASWGECQLGMTLGKSLHLSVPQFPPRQSCCKGEIGSCMQSA